MWRGRVGAEHFKTGNNNGNTATFCHLHWGCDNLPYDEGLGHTKLHKMLSDCPAQESDVECDLQQAAQTLQQHRRMLQCKDCPIKHQLRYFEAIVSSTACFAARNRRLYRKHLRKYDVQFCKLIPRIVAPPPGTAWSVPWHDILQDYNLYVTTVPVPVNYFGWSQKRTIQYWNFGSYIANLNAECWVRGTLAWKPFPTYPARRRREGNVMQVKCIGPTGSCCEKCATLAPSAFIFP